MRDLAIFAGRGRLPEMLSDAHSDALNVAFEGVGIDYQPERLIETRFERSGGLLRQLADQSIRKICFAGAISRPQLRVWKMDLATLRMLPELRRAIKISDGHSLRIVRKLVEARGFQVVAAHEILPELIAPEGQIGSIPVPDIGISLAKETHAVMSREDSGQALIIRPPALLGACEDIRGTAFMLQDAASSNLSGGYLFKASKLEQDLSMDMATIGVETVEQAKTARLDGIVLGAGITQIIDMPEVIARADALGLYICGVHL